MSTRSVRLFVVVVFAAVLMAVSWILHRRGVSQTVTPVLTTTIDSAANDVSARPASSITPPPIEQPAKPPLDEEPTLPAQPTPAVQNNYIGRLDLIVPVIGVRPDQLIDTFTAARSEGRVHDAIDIPAPANTPVVAVADGQIVKLFQSERGGTTIYQSSSNKKLIFYYAHLSGYAVGITEGKLVRQGEIIAYVGDTGNAGPGNYHLHFSISIVDDPKRYWEGTNINPFPLLHR